MLGRKAVLQNALALTLTCTATPAFASDWRYLATGANGVRLYVDIDSVRSLPPITVARPFPVRQVWIYWDYTDVSSRPYDSMKTLERVDCSAETSAKMSGVSYDKGGSVLTSWTEQDYAHHYKPVVPDSLDYSIMAFVCGWASLPSQM